MKQKKFRYYVMVSFMNQRIARSFEQYGFAFFSRGLKTIFSLCGKPWYPTLLAAIFNNIFEDISCVTKLARGNTEQLQGSKIYYEYIYITRRNYNSRLLWLGNF